MIEQLFGSKTRVKLLHLFTNNPNRAFYVREITRKIDEQINSVRRELSNLLSIGVITSESSNNRLYYEVDQKYEHYHALKSIFDEQKKASSKAKATPAAKAIKTSSGESMVDKITALGSIEIALLSGTFTRDQGSPVDLFLVGSINKTQLKNFIKELETAEGRDIRYANMTEKEYKYRIDINDRFIANLMKSKKTVIIDRTGELSE